MASKDVVTMKAGAAVEAGDLVVVNREGNVVPVGVSPKATEPRKVRVGDVWRHRLGIEEHVKLIERRTDGCFASGGMILERDGTADPRFWTLVRAAEEQAPRPQVGEWWVFLGDPHRVGLVCEGPSGGYVAIREANGNMMHMAVNHDGNQISGLWRRAEPHEIPKEAKPRPKVAVGQRWRRVSDPLAWEVHGINNSGVFAQLRCEKHSDLWFREALKDGTLPEPWEYVGEANVAPSGLALTIESVRLRLSEWGYAASVVETRGCISVDMGNVGAQDASYVGHRLGAMLPLGVALWVTCAHRKPTELPKAAAAFAFLARPEAAAHLQRMAVDSAIRACPDGLEAEGWKAAVMAWVDRSSSPEGVALRVHPLTLDVIECWIKSCEPEHIAHDKAAQDVVRAYRRALEPSPRVRRRDDWRWGR
jgi:hypothetical protein